MREPFPARDIVRRTGAFPWRRWQPVVIFILALTVYLLTLAPTVTLEDSGSFIAAAHCLGVAHPPGYPLWCLLAHGLTLLPLGAVAERVHLLSALCAAAAALVMSLAAFRLTRSRAAAWAAALVFAFSRVFWSQAVIAEVYTLHALLFGGLFYCAMRWRSSGHRGWLYGMAFITGLGLTNHLTFALIAPAPWVWAMARRWRGLLRIRRLLICLALFTAALSIYAYIPLRARADPPVNWGRAVTWQGAMRHMLRQAYYEEPELGRYAGTPADIARNIGAAFRTTGSDLTWPATLLAILGGLALTRHRRDLVGMTLAVALINIVVLNLLLRGTAAPDEYFTRRVFYIPTQMMLALWAGAAIKHAAALCRRNHCQIAGRWLAAACWLLPLAVLAANWSANDRSRDTLARDYGLDLMAAAPPGSGLFFVHDEPLFTCLYLKVVEGHRPDLAIIGSFFFGYKGQAISAVISDVPPNDALRKYYPYLVGAQAIPRGLAYRLARDAGAAPPGIFAGTPPRDPPPPKHCDPSTRRIYAAYACYHARLGAERFQAGDLTDAAREWALGEQLKVDDPYTHYVLALVYRQSGVKPERRQKLLKTALGLYRRQYSPSEFRFYPVTAKDITAQIEGEKN